MDFNGVQICGFSGKRQAAVGRLAKWPINRLTYAVVGGLGALSESDVAASAVDAWQWWADVCDIRAEYTANAKTANIVITAGRIDGASNVLAWSEMADGTLSQKQQRYDASEVWTIAANPRPGQIDLTRVQCHEIGHVLGSDHIGAGNLLAPTYDAAIRRPQPGDIAEMVARYGLPGKPTPAPLPPSGPAPSRDMADFAKAIVGPLRQLLDAVESFTKG